MLTLEFLQNYWRDGVEILILWVILYQIYRAFRGTRGARILVGLVVILLVVTLLALVLKLEVISFILKGAALTLSLALAIIFQPELRSALARLGNSRLLSLFSGNTTKSSHFLGSIAHAIGVLASKRFGALIAIERKNELEDQHETGVGIDGKFSTELSLSVFHPKSALHDGGMIISSNRIAAAGCVFPVSQKEMSDRTLGLRHRAAAGLTEETDAVVIVVSEETGRMSIAVDGKLTRIKDQEELLEELEDIFLSQEKKEDDETLASEDGGSDTSDSDMVSS